MILKQILETLNNFIINIKNVDQVSHYSFSINYVNIQSYL